MELVLEAGSRAFGNGQHETTQLMVAMLAELPEQFAPQRVLDVGCGSGILALLAAKRWKYANILATDLDADAIAACARNAERNGVETQLTALRADGLSHASITKGAPYQLILANVLAEPLRSWAAGIEALLDLQGVVLLSGLLRWQQQEIVAAYTSKRMKLLMECAEGDWVGLMLGKD